MFFYLQINVFNIYGHSIRVVGNMYLSVAATILE